MTDSGHLSEFSVNDLGGGSEFCCLFRLPRGGFAGKFAIQTSV
jgi:hypothetical protein